MTERDMNTYRAYLAARSCAESLLTAHHVSDGEAPYHIRYAIKEARQMLDLLGFDVVQRTDKQEAA